MFRFAASRAARGLVARVAQRQMASQAASTAKSSSDAVPKSYLITAALASAAAVAWVYKDGGFESPKLKSDVAPATPSSGKEKTPSPSFKNLKVTTLPDGGFHVEYDNDDETVHNFYHYDKKGGVVKQEETVIVAPAPPAPVIPEEILAKIASLEANVAKDQTTIAQYQEKIAALEQAEQTRKQQQEAAAASTKDQDHSLKLVYFPIRGRAEAIRLLLIDNNIAFDDSRVGGAEWDALKPSLHFGQMPVLFDNGFQVVQSNAILRHVGQLFHLAGNNSQESSQLDLVNEGVEDVRAAYLKTIYQAWDKKDEFVAKIPQILTPLNKLVSGDFVVGNKPQYTDYSLYEVLDTLVTLSPTALDQTPNLKAFHKRMSERPNIAAYISSDKRPKQINGNTNQ